MTTNLGGDSRVLAVQSEKREYSQPSFPPLLYITWEKGERHETKDY